MLIEQIFEFKLRGPRPHGRRLLSTSTAGYCHDKIKILKENLRLDYYLLLKYCTRQCSLLSPSRVKLLTKFNPKMQDFKRVLDLS